MTRSLRTVGAGLLLLLAACGEQASRPAGLGPGRWLAARVTGLADVSGATVYEDQLLLVPGGNERALFAVPCAALTPGASVAARRLPIQVLREAPLEGQGFTRRNDLFAAQGYRLGLLWDQVLELEAVSVTRRRSKGGLPDFETVHLLERTFGVIFWGRLLRGPEGALEGLRLESAFVVPERARPGSERLDWRDASAGLTGLIRVPRPENAEDLFVIEAAGFVLPGRVRVDRLDRFGQWQGRFTLRLPEGSTPQVRDVSWADGRFVVLLRGTGDALVSISDPGDQGNVAPGASVPTPQLSEGDRWSGLCHAPDGTAYLVSEQGRVAVRPAAER